MKKINAWGWSFHIPDFAFDVTHKSETENTVKGQFLNDTRWGSASFLFLLCRFYILNWLKDKATVMSSAWLAQPFSRCIAKWQLSWLNISRQIPQPCSLFYSHCHLSGISMSRVCVALLRMNLCWTRPTKHLWTLAKALAVKHHSKWCNIKDTHVSES